ncbi:MAG: HEPN domain-containing protein [Nitrospirae bacterium]|nr:HEPN domain-containing protein [Nitrospirota bacterium]
MKPYEAWLIKAGNDLKSAIKLIEGGTPILDTAVFHTQQCAEKALKAYLSYKQQPIQRTHDVELLVELCCGLDEGFKVLLDDAKHLTPYNTAFRYPDIYLEPDEEDVLDAIEKAKKIFDYIRRKIE